jgi:Rps23 Pro-64 3,4-dihydroxylase Tpa1-like proline 4-hydroxylase
MKATHLESDSASVRSSDLDLPTIIGARIEADSTELARQWRNPAGTSVRHFIVDDLLPPATIAEIYKAFPQNSAIWQQRASFRERKKTFAKLERIDPIIGAITDAFHASQVLQSVKKVTQIEGLEADPELYAGGISMMGKGDFLNPHIDNSHDAKRERYRRLNLLFYISPDWQLTFGGNFELWDDKVTEPKVILSKYNRLVVMETNKVSWHSVNPVTIERNRCCISNYYFSKNSPEQRDYYHVTSFLGRPHQRVVRLWGRVDNFMRQWIAVSFGTSRGKSLSRYK